MFWLCLAVEFNSNYYRICRCVCKRQHESGTKTFRFRDESENFCSSVNGVLMSNTLYLWQVINHLAFERESNLLHCGSICIGRKYNRNKVNYIGSRFCKITHHYIYRVTVISTQPMTLYCLLFLPVHVVLYVNYPEILQVVTSLQCWYCSINIRYITYMLKSQNQ
jgi:hypothetical protein